jgi:hypothetical protein
VGDVKDMIVTILVALLRQTGFKHTMHTNGSCDAHRNARELLDAKHHSLVVTPTCIMVIIVINLAD